MTVKTASTAFALASTLLLTGCHTTGNTNPYVTGWDSEYMENKNPDGDKSLGMEVWYSYRTNNNGSVDWSVSYKIIAENHHTIGGWSTAADLYSFDYSFTYTTCSGTHTVGSHEDLTSESTRNKVLFSESCAHATGLPTFSSKYAKGVRYGGPSGITIEWHG